jgi:hypothetical protein
MHRLNKLRMLGRIAQDGPELANTIAYDGVADRSRAPYRVEQRGVRDHLTTLGHQRPQYGKGLGAQRQGLRTAPELLVTHIKPKGREKEKGLRVHTPFHNKNSTEIT